MSKLIVVTLILAAAITLATAADEKYVRYVTYQSDGCTGAEVATTFTIAKCLYYNAAYTYYKCQSDGVYKFDCGTDSYCTSCTSSRVVSFDCSTYSKAYHIIFY